MPTTDEPTSAAPEQNAERCWQRHVFAACKIARIRKATVFCDKPAGHGGAHAAQEGSTLFTWRDGGASQETADSKATSDVA